MEWLYAPLQSVNDILFVATDNLEWWQVVLVLADYSLKIAALGWVPADRRPSSAMAWLLAIFFIPLVALPLFLLMKQLGLVNTLGGVVVPALAGVFGIFLVRQYARSIPDELLEAARIDGAGELRIFFQIVLPMLKPVLVTLAIFTFMAAWNDFMWPLIVLTDQEHYTLPVALAALSREHIMDVEMMMAGAVVTVIPVLLLFLLLQRYYIQGLLLGSVKG